MWTFLTHKPIASRQEVQVILRSTVDGKSVFVPLALYSPRATSDESIAYIFALFRRLMERFIRSDLRIVAITNCEGENCEKYAQAKVIAKAIGECLERRGNGLV